MPTETNREKFVRLAENRTNLVLDKIRVLSNCANPYAYEYTEQDVREIFSAIESALRKARSKFQNGADPSPQEFTLSDRQGGEEPEPSDTTPPTAAER